MREQPKLHLEFYQRMPLMERCHSENFLLMWCQELSGGAQSCAETRERSAACYGLGFHSSAWRTMRYGGFVERGRAVGSTQRRFERRLSAMGRVGGSFHHSEAHSTFTSGMSERLFVEFSFMTMGKTECAIICAHIRCRSRCAKGTTSADSESTQAFPIQGVSSA